MNSIMVVDDEPMLRTILRRHLENEQYTVSEAENGVQALEQFKASPVDIVISDLNMPKMGGEELTAQIKKLNPITGIIILTAYGSLESAQRVICNGCDEYLLKPLEDLSLVSFAVHRCLQRRKLLEGFVFSKRVGQVKSALIHNVANILAPPVHDLREAIESLQQALNESNLKEAQLLAGSLADKASAVGDIVGEIIEQSDRLKNMESHKTDADQKKE